MLLTVTCYRQSFNSQLFSIPIQAHPFNRVLKAGLILFPSVLSSSSVRPSRVCLTGSLDYFAVSSHFGMNPTQPSCAPWAFPKRQSCFQPSRLCTCWALSSESPCLTLLCLTHLSRFIVGIMLLETFLVALLSQALSYQFSIRLLRLLSLLWVPSGSHHSRHPKPQESQQKPHSDELLGYHLLPGHLKHFRHTGP